jgi:hypothetical protein
MQDMKNKHLIISCFLARGLSTTLGSNGSMFLYMCMSEYETQLTKNLLLLIWYQNELDKQHGDQPHTYTDYQCPPPWNVVKIQHCNKSKYSQAITRGLSSHLNTAILNWICFPTNELS